MIKKSKADYLDPELEKNIEKVNALLVESREKLTEAFDEFKYLSRKHQEDEMSKKYLYMMIGLSLCSLQSHFSHIGEFLSSRGKTIFGMDEKNEKH